jgi:Transposase DDE domain group 1
VVEITDHVDISSWSERSRLIARRTKLTDGDQQSFADHDGYRLSVFLTNQPGQSIPQLDLDHRSHARVEDQIRQGKDCGLRNLPFREFAHNQVWVWLVMLAQDLIAWTKQLCLTETARAWELKRLRYRLLHQSARIARHARRTILRLSKDWARAGQLAAAHAKLQALPTLPSTLTHRGAAANPLKTNTGPAISVSLPTNNAAQNRRGRQHHDHANPAAHGTPNARPSRSAHP